MVEALHTYDDSNGFTKACQCTCELILQGSSGSATGCEALDNPPCRTWECLFPVARLRAACQAAFSSRCLQSLKKARNTPTRGGRMISVQGLYLATAVRTLTFCQSYHVTRHCMLKSQQKKPSCSAITPFLAFWPSLQAFLPHQPLRRHHPWNLILLAPGLQIELHLVRNCDPVTVSMISAGNRLRISSMERNLVWRAANREIVLVRYLAMVQLESYLPRLKTLESP